MTKTRGICAHTCYVLPFMKCGGPPQKDEGVVVGGGGGGRGGTSPLLDPPLPYLCESSAILTVASDVQMKSVNPKLGFWVGRPYRTPQKV